MTQQNHQPGMPGSREHETMDKEPSGVFPRAETGWGFVLLLPDGRLETVAARNAAIIGSGETADVRIDGPEVAPEHARVEVRADGVYLEDLASAAGTFVGGVRARRIGMVHGDVVRFGQTLAIFVEHGLFLYQEPFPPDRPLVAGPRDQMLFVGPALAHARAGHSFAIEGGPGLGKRTLAQLSASERSGPVVTLDAADLAPDTIARARAQRPATWILVDVDRFPRPTQMTITDAPSHPATTIVIATMETPLDRAAADGLVAPSLATLLSGRRVAIPPLSQRREDIPNTVYRLADELGIDRARISVDLMELFLRAGWPGGLTEIEDVLRKAAETTTGPIAASAVERPLSRPPSSSPIPPAADDPGLATARLGDALHKAGGSIASAARTLGISRQALYREARRLGLALGKHRTH
jgi:pSer/pThr/pTyr-binding forkhead associated (FHA) protein